MNNFLEPGVIVISALAVFITFVSIYITKWYLPYQIKSAYLKSIGSLAAAVETKESEDIGHTQRTAKLALDLAQRLNIPQKKLEYIHYAALLMNIGKASVPKTILSKSESLTDCEWEILKLHPVKSAEMVRNIPYLKPVVTHILHHHEKWDGTGYPEGLMKEDIPLESRILSISADYDSYLTDRVRQEVPLTPQQALNRMRSESGTKYDPKLFTIFEDMIKSNLKKTEELTTVES